MRDADRGGAPAHGVPGGEEGESDGPSSDGGEAEVSITQALYTPAFWRP